MSEKNTDVRQEQENSQLLQIRRDKLSDLRQRGKDPFCLTKYDVSHHSTEIKELFDELEGKTVSIAGRMLAKNLMGKASFCR